MEHVVTSDYTNVTSNENVQVFVRMRPPEDGAGVPPSMFDDLDAKKKKITIRDPNNRNYGEVSFAFDQIFDPPTQQDHVFEKVALPLVERTLSGYNSCCFAYGQTGSGKTYSMFGEDKGNNSQGVIPRAVASVFSRLMDLQRTRETAVVVSFLEIYCDQIRDLGKAYLDKDKTGGKREKTSDWYQENRRRASGVINPDQLKRTDQNADGTSNDNTNNNSSSSSRPGSKNGSRPNSRPNSKEGREKIGISKTRFAVGLTMSDNYYNQDLKIHEDLAGNVFVKGLSVIPVSTPEEAMTVVQMGFKLRATHETKMNAVSSRSHTVFTLTIVQKDHRSGDTITGMLNLVDLAGSERLNKSESTGQRMREALSINTSLTALGKVIMALDPTQKQGHVPYRDSKLTRLLQNSLGGNSYTALLATLHPMAAHHSECLSTLQFANRCRNVTNQPRVNYIEQSQASNEKQKQKMITEIATLKRTLTGSEVRHQQQLVALMAQLGIEGQVLPDGRFQTANGDVIGMTTADAAAVAADGKVMTASDLAKAAADGGIGGIGGGVNGVGGVGGGGGSNGMGGIVGGGGGFGYVGQFGGGNFGGGNGSGGGGGGGVSVEVQKHIQHITRKLEEVTSENTRVKRGLDASKHELHQIHETAEKDKDRLTLHIKRQHDQIQSIKQEQEQNKSSAESKYQMVRDQHQEQVDLMLDNNQRIMSEATKRINQVPTALRMRSDILHQAQREAASSKTSMIAKYTKLMETMKRGYELEIENLKQQHTYLMTEKGKEQRKFVKDFNKYYEKKTKQVNGYKDELVLLYQHCCALSTMCQKMETNVYPVRTTRTGIRTFSIPDVDRPHNIFHDKTRLPLLRNQLKMSRQGVKHLKEQDEKLGFNISKSVPMHGVGGVGGDVGDNNDSNSKTGTSTTTTIDPRPHSAAATTRQHRSSPQQQRATTAQSRHSNANTIVTSNANQDYGEYQIPVMIPLLFPRDDIEDNLQLEQTMSQMGVEELQTQIKEMRTYIKSGLRRKVEEQVLNDLSSHETIAYIKAVEDEREHYRKQLDAERGQNKQLRVSRDAQVRRLQKLRHGSGSRPSTTTGRPSTNSVHSRRSGRRPQSAQRTR